MARVDIDYAECWKFYKNLTTFIKLTAALNDEGRAVTETQLETIKAIESMFGKLTIGGKSE